MRSGRLRSVVGLVRWLACLALLACAAPVRAADDPFDGRWHFALTPYLWAPGLDGDLKYHIPPGAGGNPEVHAGPADVLGFLNFAIMGAFDARKGNWSAFTDFIYLDLSGNKARVKDIIGPGGAVDIPVNLNTEIGLSGFVWTGAFAYSLYHSKTMSSDVFAGVRDFSTDASLDWNFSNALSLFPKTGSFTQHQNLVDGLIGVRGRINLGGSDWFLPYYADIGTGSSNFTTQAMTGIGYGFSWGDLRLVYRYLYYEPGQDKLITRMAIHGLAFGATFRF